MVLAYSRCGLISDLYNVLNMCASTLMCRIIEVTIIKVELRMCGLIVEANFPFNSSVCLALYKYHSHSTNAMNIAGIFFKRMIGLEITFEIKF